jgi:hypothetical protein
MELVNGQLVMQKMESIDLLALIEEAEGLASQAQTISERLTEINGIIIEANNLLEA